jgi:hypothetical protein
VVDHPAQRDETRDTRALKWQNEDVVPSAKHRQPRPRAEVRPAALKTEPQRAFIAARGSQTLWKHPYSVAAVTLVIILACAAALFGWLHTRNYESTDDAFVDTRIVPISSQVAGAIVELPVTDNQFVKEGGALLRIDDRDYRAALDQAAAQVEQMESSIAYLAAEIEPQQAVVDADRRRAALVTFAAAVLPLRTSTAYSKVDHAAIARASLTEVIRPGYAALATTTGALKDKMGALCKQPSADALDQAKSAFTGAVDALSKVEILRFGPITQDQRYERLFHWPDPKGIDLQEVQDVLAKHENSVTLPDELAAKSAALQGLPALEYLLYGESEHKHRARREKLAILSLFIGTAFIACSTPAFADWWIVRSSDETCLVVDIEPKPEDKGVTKIGKDAYRTAEEAEADVKRLCKESKAEPKHDTKGNQ